MAVCSAPDVAQVAVGLAHRQFLSEVDRRNLDARDRLLRRIRSEFLEMPCLRLTESESRRLFGLRDDVCRRLLATLVGEGIVWQGHDGRYGVRASH